MSYQFHRAQLSIVTGVRMTLSVAEAIRRADPGGWITLFSPPPSYLCERRQCLFDAKKQRASIQTKRHKQKVFHECHLPEALVGGFIAAYLNKETYRT